MIILFIWRICTKLFVYFHCRTKSSGLVHIQCDKHFITFFYFCSLFFERKQKVFFQSPVKERPDSSGICNFQYCQFI